MEDYFSIDDILATEPRLYCTFRMEGHMLAHLDPVGIAAHMASLPSKPLPSSATPSPPDATIDPDSPDPSTPQHIPAGHRLALPYWLVESLSERGAVTLELPRCFSTPTLNALRADARSVQLFARCEAYYALGIRLSRLVRDGDLPPALVRAYSTRAWPLVDAAVFSAGRGLEALRALDRLERRLFFAAHGTHMAVRRWKERRADRIAVSETVLGKRRGRVDDVASPVTPRQRVS